MKKILIFILCCILMYSSAYGEQSYGNTTGIQFALREDMTPSWVLGQSLSLLRRQDIHTAVRYGLSLHGETQEHGLYDSTYIACEGIMQYVRYTRPGSRVQSYYGFGPQLSYSYSEVDDSITRRIGIGGVFSFGAEYYFVPTISGFVEYTTIANYEQDYRNNWYSFNMRPHVYVGVTLYIR